MNSGRPGPAGGQYMIVAPQQEADGAASDNARDADAGFGRWCAEVARRGE